MTVVLSPRQREAVFEPARHLLVAAGAGTGKTSTVVARLCYLLGLEVDGRTIAPEHQLSLAQIAAITFTNAAAADLKDKLRRALREGGRRDLAIEVETARIGTIHSFCGDLLSEFALHAELPPNRTVLEEDAARALLGECVRETLIAALSSSPSPELMELAASFQLKVLEGSLRELAEDAERLDHLRTSELRAHEQLLLELARAAAATFRSRLASERAIDFDGMIVGTRNLLRDHPHVLEVLQQRLRLLIVDEFQDVDPLQREVAWLIGAPDSGSHTTPRLMLVGDPKQSIYRFRRADVTLWNGVAEAFSTIHGTAIVTLDQSFRSVPSILGFVDAIAGVALDLPVGAERAPYEVDYVALHSDKVEVEGRTGVELHLLPAREDGKPLTTPEARARDAAAIARRIHELQAADPTLKLRDIAILLSGWSALETYERALRSAGIATYALRTEGFWTRPEIQDLLIALRAVRDRTDDVALVGFLRGPWAGVRDETLYALARAREQSLADTLSSASGPDAPIIADAIALLDRFSALRDRIPLHDLIRRLLEDSGYLAWRVAQGTTGAQAVANLRKVIRIAASDPALSLGDFLRLAQERQDSGVREGDARLYTERDDVVTITSIHSAKGLDWRVVIWADMMREPEFRSEPLVRGRSIFRLKQEIAGAKDPDWQAVLDAEKQEHLAELRRLWYVALTRAKDRLICTGIRQGAKSGVGSPEAWILQSLPSIAPGPYTYHSAQGTEFTLDVRSIDAPALEPIEPSPIAMASLATHRTELSAARGRGRLSATQLMMHDRDPARWRERYLLRLADLPQPATEPTHDQTGTTASRPSARVTGSIIHDVLERWAEEYSLDGLLDSAIERLGDEDPLGWGAPAPEARTALRELLARVVADPRWAARAADPSARREMRFTRLLADGLTIEGAFDLILLEDGAVRIVDVKTSSGAEPSALAEGYRVQGEVYAEAAGAITGRSIAGFTLYLTDRGLEVEVPHHASRTLDERVRALTG